MTNDILDKLPLGVLIYNREAELVYCNVAADRLLSALADVGVCVLSNELQKLAKQTLLGTDDHNKLVQLEFQEYRATYRATTSILNPDSPQVMITLLDETANEQLKQTLLKAESLSVVGQLAIGALTEMINPLTIACGFCQLLVQNERLPYEFTDIIRQELDAMRSIVGKFTYLSQTIVQGPSEPPEKDALLVTPDP